MIAGFCWPQSGLPGTVIEVFCHTDSRHFSSRVVRAGPVEKEVMSRVSIPGVVQKLSASMATDGCDWQPAFALAVDPAWPSGLYRVDFESSDGSHAQAYFVVRTEARVDATLVLATNTWAAYNHWGGPSFYTGGTTSALRRPLPHGMLHQSRPHDFRIARYHTRDQATQQDFRALGYSHWCAAAGWANWEHLFAHWAEQQGYQLAYATSQDLHSLPDLLARNPAYISVGHDEYWTASMRDQVENFVEEGGHAAFFSGNTAFWQARLNSTADTLTCFKTNFRDDPAYSSTATECPQLSTMWSDPLVGRPENHMTGVSFTRGGYAQMPNAPAGTGGYQIHRPDHWSMQGVVLADDAQLGDQALVVGYECDGCAMETFDGLPHATGEDGSPTNMEIIGTGPARLWETEDAPAALGEDFIGELNWVAERIGGADTAANRTKFGDGRAVLGSFKRGQGEVFTTGCTDWAYGLHTAPIAQVTNNVLTRFVQRT
ncbi:MAG: N,N-dimethylformamidase beta subunit family domain-containing protein [Pseudomonadota bacterium]